MQPGLRKPGREAGRAGRTARPGYAAGGEVARASRPAPGRREAIEEAAGEGRRREASEGGRATSAGRRGRPPDPAAPRGGPDPAGAEEGPAGPFSASGGFRSADRGRPTPAPGAKRRRRSRVTEPRPLPTPAPRRPSGAPSRRQAHRRRRRRPARRTGLPVARRLRASAPGSIPFARSRGRRAPKARRAAIPPDPPAEPQGRELRRRRGPPRSIPPQSAGRGRRHPSKQALFREPVPQARERTGRGSGPCRSCYVRRRGVPAGLRDCGR